jgi:acetyl esterase
VQPPDTHSIEEAELVYATVDGVELRARTYRPKLAGRLPALIDIHGGAWSSSDRNAGEVYDRALATAGLFVLAIDFRQGPAFKHPAASQDIATAWRYLHSQAETLRIDPASIGLVGSSSGGHLALLAGVAPHSGTPAAGVRYIIGLWPVSNPAYRYEYALRVGRTELVRGHDAYFGTREIMQRANVPRVLRAGEHTHLPPLLLVQAGNDANVPAEMTLDLLAAYQDAGGRVEYSFYPGQPHAFGLKPSSDTSHLTHAMSAFIKRVLDPPQS